MEMFTLVLPSTPTLKKTRLGASLGHLRENLRIKVNNQKRNTIRGLLNDLLYEIRPVTNQQKAMIPSVAIQVPAGGIINACLSIRKRERALNILRPIRQTVESTDHEVHEFLRMFLRMKFDQNRVINLSTPAKIVLNVVAAKIRSPKNKLINGYLLMTSMMNIFQGDVDV